jgi:hypothetical protein
MYGKTFDQGNFPDRGMRDRYRWVYVANANWINGVNADANGHGPAGIMQVFFGILRRKIPARFCLNEPSGVVAEKAII